MRHKLRKGPSFSLRALRAQPPQSKTRWVGFTLPTLPHQRITPSMSSGCTVAETKDSCAGERKWFRTGGFTWFHSLSGVPHSSTPHRGSLSPHGETVPLPIGGVFPHRGRSLHLPPGESFPTGGDHFTLHRVILSPQGEIALLPPWGSFPHRGSGPFYSPLGELLPFGGELPTPRRGSIPSQCEIIARPIGGVHSGTSKEATAAACTYRVDYSFPLRSDDIK
jgi:hypothetical protein